MQEKKLGVLHLESVINYQQKEIERLQTLAHIREPNLLVARMTLSPLVSPLTNVVTATLPSLPVSLSNPKVLTNGVKGPQFKYWLLQIEGKLVVNVDHFPTEVQQITYV